MLILLSHVRATRDVNPPITRKKMSILLSHVYVQEMLIIQSHVHVKGYANPSITRSCDKKC